LFGGPKDGEDEEEFNDLELSPVCSNDPDTTRRWRVRNINEFEVPVYWNIKNTTQSGDFVAPATGQGSPMDQDSSGDLTYTFFETNTEEESNRIKIWWYDKQMNEYSLESASSAEECMTPPTCDQSGLEITTDVLPKAEWYQLYTTTLTGSGGKTPYLWNIVWEESSLPGNFIIGQYDGKLSGIPKAGTDTDYPLWIKLTDDNSCSVDKYFNFSVDSMYDCSKSDISITTASIPEATSGESYTAQIEAVGGIRPYTWEIIAEETTVPGYLTIDQSTGVVTGTPDGETGTYALALRVKDSGDCSITQTYNTYLNPQENEPELPYDVVMIRGRLINRFTKEPISGARFQWVTHPDNPDYYRQITWDPWTKYDATWSDENGNFEIDLPYPLMLGRNSNEQVVSIQAYGCSFFNNNLRLRNTNDESLYEMGFQILDKIPQHETTYIKINSDDYNVGDVELWPHAYTYIKSDVTASLSYNYPEDSASVHMGWHDYPVANSGKYTKSVRTMLAKHYDTEVNLRIDGTLVPEIINYDNDEVCGGGVLIEIKDGEVIWQYGVPDEEDILIRWEDPNLQ